MRYREVGRTGVSVSEVGFGAEWIDKGNLAATRALFDLATEAGVNVVDCWMSDPDMRTALGFALEGRRDRWVVQGHIGSTWQGGQYVRSRDMRKVVPAFEDLLARLGTDRVEFGMLHFVDTDEDYDVVMGLAPATAESERALGNDNGELETNVELPESCLAYAKQLKAAGIIGHIGMSTHNPAIAQRAAESGEVELILFSLNPAFDMLSAGVEISALFKEETFAEGAPALSAGISTDRARLYATCEERGVGITVMKGYEGGRLLKAETSPFGVALTPVQCLHYALTRPAVASVLVGACAREHLEQALAYETASPQELDYASVLASAPRNAFGGRCTYCGHCAPCPQGIEVALVQKYADLAQMQPEVPASVADHYRALSAHASDCAGCGACESRCPFGVAVVERMAQVAELFGE